MHTNKRHTCTHTSATHTHAHTHIHTHTHTHTSFSSVRSSIKAISLMPSEKSSYKSVTSIPVYSQWYVVKWLSSQHHIPVTPWTLSSYILQVEVPTATNQTHFECQIKMFMPATTPTFIKCVLTHLVNVSFSALSYSSACIVEGQDT